MVSGPVRMRGWIPTVVLTLLVVRSSATFTPIPVSNTPSTTGPVSSAQPSLDTKATGSTDLLDKTEPVSSAQPSLDTKATGSTDLLDKTGPVSSVQPALDTKATGSTDLLDKTGPVSSAQSSIDTTVAGSTDLLDKTGPVSSAQPSIDTTVAGSTDLQDKTGPVSSVQPSLDTKATGSTDLLDKTRPVSSAQPSIDTTVAGSTDLLDKTGPVSSAQPSFDTKATGSTDLLDKTGPVSSAQPSLDTKATGSTDLLDKTGPVSSAQPSIDTTVAGSTDLQDKTGPVSSAQPSIDTTVAGSTDLLDKTGPVSSAQPPIDTTVAVSDPPTAVASSPQTSSESLSVTLPTNCWDCLIEDDESLVPDSPTKVAISPQTSSVSLTVTLSTDCPDCQSVIVTYLPDGGTAMTTTNKSCDQTPCIVPITDLTAGTCYSFKVYTQGSSGNSTTSTNSTGCTLPAPPTKVILSPQTSSVSLTVTLPTDCPDCKSVIVTYSPDGGTAMTTTKTCHQSPCNVSITDLTAGTCYSFKVYTQGSSGNSTMSTNKKGCTLPALPAKVTLSPQTSSVSLTVTLPTDCPDCKSVIVTYSPDGGTAMTTTKTCHQSPCNVSITDLTAGTCYSFKVYTQGSSGNSTTSTNSTGCTLPDPPEEVAMSNFQSSSVSLTVTLPTTCPGCKSVIVTYSPVGGTAMTTTTKTCHQSPCNVSIPDLTAGTCYSFKVYTQGSSGNSTMSTNKKGCTLPALPAKVTLSPQTSSVSLTVTLPTDCPDCKSVIVTYSPDGGTAMTTTKTCHQSPCNVSITDLTAGTCYSFKVYTQGSSGNSTTSTNSTGCTLPDPPEEVAMSNFQSSSVSLTVTLPTTCPGCKSVIVTYSPVGGTAMTTTTKTCHQSPCNVSIPDLTAGTCYSFAVYTQGSSGNSTMSTNKKGCTLPSAPSDVTVSDRTTTSVTLTVTPGPWGYDGYRVQTVGDGINRNETFLHNTAGDRLLVSGLTPGTTFTFTVFTLANGSESKDFYRTQHSTRPTAPYNVTISSQTNVSVTLTVTPLDNGYDGFLVEYNNLNQTFENITADDVTNGSHNVVVDKLTPGTTYTFDVYTLYNGSTSTNSTGNTGSTVPNPPGNVTVIGQTNSTVTLTITSTSTGGVDNYTVTFTDRDGTTKTRNTTNNHSSYTVDNLTSGYTYNFTVTSVYKGLSSTPYQDVPASTVPSVPSDVTVSDRTTTSLTLNVTPGPGGYDGYRVQTVGDGINRSETFLHNETGDRLQVGSLTPGTTFTFTVFTLANGLESTDFYRTQDSTSDKVKRSDNPIQDEPTEEPAAPNNVEVKSQTNMSVTLTVTQPDNGYDGFLVKYSNLNQTFTADGVTSVSHSLIVNNLTPGTTYTFNVYTLYNGSTSTNSTGNTGSTVPNPPGNVTVTTQTNSTVTLDITLPSTGGVDNYSVTFTDRDGTKETRNTTNNHTSYRVDKLTSGYAYTFTVASVYKGLSSIPHQDVPASTVPAAPTKDKTSTTEDSIKVTLTAPAPGFVDHYNVSEKCVSSNSINPAGTVSGQTVKIGGLSHGTTCNLTVIAVFNGLYSPVAIFSGLSIGETSPGQVEDLAAQTVSATAVRLTWKTPLRPNGDIILYSVYVTDPEGTCVQHVQITKVGGTASQVNDTCKETKTDTFVNDQSEFNKTINDLLAYTHYTFGVFAYTVAGKGPESNKTSNTSQSEPHKITDLTPNNTSSSTITLSFNEPRPSTGPIMTYEVQYVYMERVCNKGLGTGVLMTNHTNCTPSSGRTVCSIDNLYPYWDYSIRVRAYTSKGHGNWSDSLVQRTGQDKPSFIDLDSIKPSVITANSVTLEWSAPCPPNGVITNYVILCKWNMSSPIITPDNSTSYLVPDLLPYRNYTYQIAAQTVAGKGIYTTEKSFTTLTDAPHQPGQVTVIETKATSIKVTWGTPDIKTGPTSYVATAIDRRTQKNTSSCYTEGFDKTTCMIKDLDEYWNYTIVVMATTVNGSNSSSTNMRTEEAVPGPVTDFSVIVEKDVLKARTVKVTCDLPIERDLNGVITNYILEWGYSTTQNQSTNKTCYWDVDVKPQQTYLFNVSASTKVGKGSSLQNKQVIPAGAPLIAKNSEKMIKVGSSSAVNDPEKQFRIDFDITLVCDDRNGMIDQHYVFVSESTQTTSNNVAEPFQGSVANFDARLKEYQTWSAVEDADKISPYVASRSWSPCNGHGSRRRRRATTQFVQFIVGEGRDCSGDCNGYVQPGKSYRVRVASCTAGGCSESEWSAAVQTEPNLVPSIVGGVVGALIAVFIFLAVMFVLRRRSLLCFKKDNESGFTNLSGKTNTGYHGDSTEMVVVKARKIKVSEFAEKYYQLSKDSNMKFSEEAKLIKEMSPIHKTTCAEEQAVRIKNRYTNILAFDHSRVKLLPLDEEDGSDYINANYIPGFHSKREYIATQGPLVCTKDDFWRMIWEQNVSVIVMLTQLVERGRRKCDQYWPEVVSEPVYFGDLVVRIDSESNLPDYVIRVISLQLGDVKRQIKHLLYLAWPDMGTPTTSNSMLNFVKSCRNHKNSPDGPIVVHCSAGVGRTGTFIAVDHLMQKLNAGHQEVDIFNMVLGMRNERPNMVQTEDQYIFIHECIKDFLSSDEDDEEEEEEEEEEEDCDPIYQNA